MSETQAITDYLLQKMNVDYRYVFETKARITTLEQKNARLRLALTELLRAASDTANEHGCSGDLGARLSDARVALKETP